jgi:hypothetical protein
MRNMKQMIYNGSNEPIAIIGKEALDCLLKSGDIVRNEESKQYVATAQNFHEILFEVEKDIQMEIDEILWGLNDCNCAIERTNTKILLAKDSEDIQRNVKFLSTLTQQVGEFITILKNLNK